MCACIYYRSITSHLEKKRNGIKTKKKTERPAEEGRNKKEGKGWEEGESATTTIRRWKGEATTAMEGQVWEEGSQMCLAVKGKFGGFHFLINKFFLKNNSGQTRVLVCVGRLGDSRARLTHFRQARRAR